MLFSPKTEKRYAKTERVIDASRTYLASSESPLSEPLACPLCYSYKTSPILKCLLFTIPTATITCCLDFANPLTGLPISTISSLCAVRESKNVYYTMWLPTASYRTQQENKLLPLAYKAPLVLLLPTLLTHFTLLSFFLSPPHTHWPSL